MPCSWGTSSRDLSKVKCSCGSCTVQLPDLSSECKDPARLEQNVMSLQHFFKNVLSSSLQNGSARARARVTKNTDPKSNLGIHVVCIHVGETCVTQRHNYNSSFNMKSIMRRWCSAEPIFEAPCRYIDADSSDSATVTTPNRGGGQFEILQVSDTNKN